MTRRATRTRTHSHTAYVRPTEPASGELQPRFRHGRPRLGAPEVPLPGCATPRQHWRYSLAERGSQCTPSLRPINDSRTIDIFDVASHDFGPPHVKGTFKG
jgi:hypothetical protein